MSVLLDTLLPFEPIPGLEVTEPEGPLQELVMSTDWQRLYEDMDEMSEAAPRIAKMFEVVA